MDIRVKVSPKSSKTELTGYLPDGTWKVKVAAAPEKGRANRALCEFLAEKLGVAKSKVQSYCDHEGFQSAPSTITSGTGVVLVAPALLVANKE